MGVMACACCGADTCTSCSDAVNATKEVQLIFTGVTNGSLCPGGTPVSGCSPLWNTTFLLPFVSGTVISSGDNFYDCVWGLDLGFSLSICGPRTLSAGLRYTASTDKTTLTVVCTSNTTTFVSVAYFEIYDGRLDCNSWSDSSVSLLAHDTSYCNFSAATLAAAFV